MQKECSRNKKKRNDSCQLMALHRIGRRSLTTLGTANICNDGRECCCPMSSAPRRLEQANDAHHSRQSCKMDLRTEEPSTKSKYPEAHPSPHPRLALGSCIRHDGLCRGRRRSWIAEVRFFYSRSGFRFWGLARVMDEMPQRLLHATPRIPKSPEKQDLAPGHTSLRQPKPNRR